MNDSSLTVLVVGGGYAGVLAANRVAGKLRRAARVVLVSDRDELVHRVRLHEMAAGTGSRRYPLARVLSSRVEHVRARVTRVDADAFLAHLDDGGALPYDFLIIAAGSAPSAAGSPVASPEAALAFAERLRRLPDGASIAVIGGGLTGVELAAELADAHPHLAISLHGEVLGAGWDEGARAAAREGLAALGVAVHEGARVDCVDADLVVPATGFTVSPLACVSGLPVDAHGRLIVDETLRVPGHPEIVGAGDAVATPSACVLGPVERLRMGCATAMPLGAHAADVVVAAVRGEPPRAFRFGFVIQCVSLGRRRGLIVRVDHGDRPIGRLITGRTGALVKELVCRMVIGTIRLERALPGIYTWPGAGVRPPPLLPAGHTRDAA